MKESVKKEWQRIKKLKRSWINISVYQKLSEDFIREFKDKVDWNLISRYQNLSEDFIREFKDKVDWFYISKYQKLSEYFIKEFKDKVDWDNITEYHRLSEDFIREFKDRIDWRYWRYISAYQKLSEDFIREFKDRVSWYYISLHQRLSEDFIREFKDKVFSNLIQKTKSDEQKLEEIKKYAKKYNLEFDGEWLYAYREHDKWNRGVWNKTISYDKFNEEYRDWHCDINENNANSFGLGIWPKNKGVNVRVKVYYKDWGCGPVDSEGKGRVWAFTLLEKV